MGESKTIIKETEKSSSKSPTAPHQWLCHPNAGLSEAGPLSKGGEHHGAGSFPPFTKKGGYGWIFWRIFSFVC